MRVPRLAKLEPPAPMSSDLTTRSEANVPAPPEVVVADGHRVSCDGGGGALGHPRVYMELGDKPYVECLYCDRRFVRGEGGH